MVLNIADMIFIGSIILAILYGYCRGIFGILRKFIAIVIARIAQPYLLAALNGYGFTANISKMIEKKMYDGSKIMAQTPMYNIAGAIGEGLATIVVFAITYLIIRIITGFVFKLIKPRARLLRTLDSFLGIVLSVIFVIILFCFIYSLLEIGAGIEEIRYYKELIDKSGILKSVIVTLSR